MSDARLNCKSRWNCLDPNRAQLELQNKGCSIKGLVVCKNLDFSAFGHITNLAWTCR